MAQTTSHVGDRHQKVRDLQDTLDVLKREQNDLAEEIRHADEESRHLPGDVRSLLGGPLEDPVDTDHRPGGPRP